MLEEEEEAVIPIVSTPIEKEAISAILNTVEEVNKRVEKALLEAKEAKLKERQTKLKLKEVKQQANKIIRKLDKSKRNLMIRLNRQIKLRKGIYYLNKNIEKILNNDQIEMLCQPSQRCSKWSKDTLKRALRLKLSCGSSAYNEILRQGIPLPSERTLRRRLEGMDFQPGVSKNMFDLLSEQVSLFIDERERDCMLTLDEMSIAEGEQTDLSTMSYMGLSTLPDRNGKL